MIFKVNTVTETKSGQGKCTTQNTLQTLNTSTFGLREKLCRFYI